MINVKSQRLLARLLLPFVTLWLVILPSRSYAIIPALIPLAGVFLEADAVATAGTAASIAIAEAATGVSAGAIAAGAASLEVVDAVATGIVTTIGAVVTYLAVTDSNGKTVRVPLVADPVKGKIPAPTGATSMPATYGLVYNTAGGSCITSDFCAAAACAAAYMDC